MTQHTIERDQTGDAIEPPVSSKLAIAVDRRIVERFAWALQLKLTAMGRSDAHICKSSDIGASGAFVQVPSDYGLVVGQRCEVEILEPAEEPDSGRVVGETRFATVVRTERSDIDDAFVGAGLRFDQPLYF